MEKLTFLKLAEILMIEEKRPLSPMEIWELAKIKGYDKQVGTQGKTPWQTIGALIYINIRDNPKSVFVKIKSKPTKFYLKELVSQDEITKIENKEKNLSQPAQSKLKERDLHPFLAYYAYTYMLVYTKTIYHEKSNKKSYSQWLHPDMVGVYFPIGEWTSEVLDFSKELGSTALKLYSFELKQQLDFTNLREAFFQTVSNSSWANEAYLVAAEINADEDFRNELKRLSSSFGIGIISLNIEDPDATEVLFPAKYRSELDWDNMNKLANENPDFGDFLVRVRKDFVGNEIWKEQYDKVIEPGDLTKCIRK